MKDFLEKLQNYDKTFDKKDINKLGFYPSVADELKYELLKKGWWSLYHIFSGKYWSYGLSIQPQKSYTDWYVMEMSERGDSCATFAPGVMNFWYFRHLELLLRLKVFNAYEDKYLEREKVSLPFLESFNIEKDYIYFRDYFLNKTIIPDSDEKIDQIYLHFWNYFDKSKGHDVLRKIITEFKNNEGAVISELDVSKLEHWAIRILYVLVKRFIKHSFMSPNNNLELETVCWKLFTAAHIYDAEDMCPSHIGESIRNPRMELRTTVDYLTLATNNHSDYIKNSPLFPALRKIDENDRTYIGVEHVEAAAIYDIELNDPIMSWNCLVNAGYWSGANTSETLLPAWKAAIDLAERNDWKDAYFALKTQYDWYMNFKKQNNLA